MYTLSEQDINTIMEGINSISNVLSKLSNDKDNVNYNVNHNAKAIRIVCIPNGEERVFESITEGAKYLKIPRKTLSYNIANSGMINVHGVDYTVSYYHDSSNTIALP